MLRSVIALLLALAGACSAWAQSYPARSVKIVVPFGTGGPADIYGRFLAAKLTDSLGHPFVVEDRPGAGSIVGSDAVAKSAPDGYTLLVMSSTHTVNETLVPKKPFDLMKDFAPITGINYSDLMMVIHLISPDGTLDQQYISNYASINIKDVITRIDGVDDTIVFSARDYSMRI